MSDPSGSTTYAYDVRDRFTSKASPQGILRQLGQPSDFALCRRFQSGMDAGAHETNPEIGVSHMTDQRLGKLDEIEGYSNLSVKLSNQVTELMTELSQKQGGLDL